jgi:hypothetical protein
MEVQPMFSMLLALVAPIAQEAPLAWLEGGWCTELAEGRQTCELWTIASDGIWTGRSEIRRGAEARSGETMRITRGTAGWTFHAEPPGQAPTDFQMISGEATPVMLSFENRRHDYPQRIRYWREGELLMAEIALADGSQARRWTFHRVAK